MAKGNGAEDRAKVKLRVIEFELEGGNASVENSIRQLTHALTNRTSAPTKPLSTKTSAALTAGEEPEMEVEDAEIVEPEADVNGDEPMASKPSKKRYKPRVPTYLHDLDMQGTGGVPFKEYATQKAPTLHTRRYLAAAMWLKEYGGSPTVNTDKVFTCYRTAGWPLNIPDWDVNLRTQIKTDRFRRVSPGEYAITPMGESELQKPD
jgi:hypothetical protein